MLLAMLTLGLVAPFACAAPLASAAKAPATPYDFDGDGRPELVAAAPGLTIGSVKNAGGVAVLPGTKSGLSLRERLLTGNALGADPEYVEYGTFGSGIASADFNRDGYADLALTTSEYIGYGTDVEVVTVLPGSSHGLDLAHRTRLYNKERYDDNPYGLSSVLLAADLTGDGYPDLAVGVPTEEVQVFSGGRGNLAQAAGLVLHGQGPGGGSEAADSGFGSSLAAGDLNGDGAIDLVVGSYGRNDPGRRYPGSVSVCPGAPGGPTGCTRVAHSPAYAGPTTMAVGRVTGGARPDLVVAVPDPDGKAVGSVKILQLKPSGAIATARTLVLAQGSGGVPGVGEPDDAFGSALGVTDLDSDGFADLVVGAPGENGGKGQVTLVHGAAGGWRRDGSSTLDQATAGVPGKAEKKDRFGSSLTLLDHDGDGLLDLDVGSPGEDGSGAVTTLRGSGTGFTTKGSKAFGLKTLGIGGRKHAGFGDPLGS